VPRAMNRVKDKATAILRQIRNSRGDSRWLALGAIDQHLHGAFGVDVMSASASQLESLSVRLFEKGVAAFLPTTISASIEATEEALSNVGAWVSACWKIGPQEGKAFPFGLHLEGPFIARSCCGAHPQNTLIAPSLKLLQRWQELSMGTIAKVTLAPETAPWSEILKILNWAKAQKIAISIGHSRADSLRTRRTLDHGASSLTHAWNAMPFHHRDPGILGDALGRNGLFVEIIPDNIHVSDTVVSWTTTLHPQGICWVSDAVPAAHTRKQVPFGPIRVRIQAGAGRTPDGALAGGGSTLLEMATAFWNRQKNARTLDPSTFLKALTVWPLESLPRASWWTEALNRTHVREYRFGRKLSSRPVNSRT
jgi:N-acetylglucosamine-6-phosphate deacetylase